MYIELINHNDHVETLKSHDQSAWKLNLKLNQRRRRRTEVRSHLLNWWVESNGKKWMLLCSRFSVETNKYQLETKNQNLRFYMEKNSSANVTSIQVSDIGIWRKCMRNFNEHVKAHNKTKGKCEVWITEQEWMNEVETLRSYVCVIWVSAARNWAQNVGCLIYWVSGERGKCWTLVK